MADPDGYVRSWRVIQERMNNGWRITVRGSRRCVAYVEFPDDLVLDAAMQIKPYAAYALPANAESTRVRATAKPIRLGIPSRATTGVTPRRSRIQKEKQPAISKTTATAKMARFAVTLRAMRQ
jgi:hypothetical protein